MSAKDLRKCALVALSKPEREALRRAAAARGAKGLSAGARLLIREAVAAGAAPIGADGAPRAITLRLQLEPALRAQAPDAAGLLRAALACDSRGFGLNRDKDFPETAP